jgi:hypothetical protein
MNLPNDAFSPRCCVHGPGGARRDIIWDMQAFKAHVRSGRIVVDEPTDLPEGTELRLVVVEEGDDFDDQEGMALHQALARGSADIAAGRTADAMEFLASLDARR